MKFFVILSFVICSHLLLSQVVEKPNFALSTHPIMVEKYHVTGQGMTVELSLENQAANGSFCADKNIYIADIDSEKTYRLIYTSGIPTCPEQHNFKNIGEKLSFQLYFPQIDSSIRYVNIIEDCDEYCFRIYGLILDDSLNNTINEGYAFFMKGNYAAALSAFDLAVANSKSYPFGHIIFNLIQVQAKLNHLEEAKKWYEHIKSSDFIDKDFIMDKVKNETYYYLLEESK